MSNINGDFLELIADWFYNNNLKPNIDIDLSYYDGCDDVLILSIKNDNEIDKYKFYQNVEKDINNNYKYSSFTMIYFNENEIIYDYYNIINYLKEKYNRN
jgi:hypothetical protein